MNQKLVLTPAEVAERLGFHTDTVYGLIRRRILPSVRIGQRRYVPAGRLDAWIAERTEGGDGRRRAGR